MHQHDLLRQLYRVAYWVLVLVLFGLVIISPIDFILQAFRRTTNQTIKTTYLIIIGGAYALTFFLTVALYSLRLWENRKSLNDIPKICVPVEVEDVPKYAREIIIGSLNRSAMVAWDARPRVQESSPVKVLADPNVARPVATPSGSATEKDVGGTSNNRSSSTQQDGVTIAKRSRPPVWGRIVHAGWNSPTRSDHPNLQYISVVRELPHLIEAQAVAVAPSNPNSISNPPMPDLRAVDILQRPSSMGLRDYISHLMELGVLPSEPQAIEFLSAYEHARFCPKPLSESDFENLLKLFAEVLRSMQPLSQAVLDSLNTEDLESDTDDDASTTSTPRSRSILSGRSASTRSGSEGTIRTAPSRRVPTTGSSPTRKQLDGPGPPMTPKSKKRIILTSPSVQSFSQSKRPYTGGSDSSSSRVSSSQGSVIRLSPKGDRSELPFIITTPRTQQS